jgi:hypothetical protein
MGTTILTIFEVPRKLLDECPQNVRATLSLLGRFRRERAQKHQ